MFPSELRIVLASFKVGNHLVNIVEHLLAGETEIPVCTGGESNGDESRMCIETTVIREQKHDSKLNANVLYGFFTA